MLPHTGRTANAQSGLFLDHKVLPDRGVNLVRTHSTSRGKASRQEGSFQPSSFLTTGQGWGILLSQVTGLAQGSYKGKTPRQKASPVLIQSLHMSGRLGEMTYLHSYSYRSWEDTSSPHRLTRLGDGGTGRGSFDLISSLSTIPSPLTVNYTVSYCCFQEEDYLYSQNQK